MERACAGNPCLYLIFEKMIPDEVQRELESIIQGHVIEESGNSCRAIRNYLCDRFETSRTVKKDFESKQRIKEEQGISLRNFCNYQGLWISQLPDTYQYLTRGGEAFVFLDSDGRHVVKLNDAVYYATWLEYFNSVVIHNLLFPDTAYECIGMMEWQDHLRAVMRQRFVSSQETAELQAIRSYLEYNGFMHTRRQDYFCPQYGLILEDMHDENVIQVGDSLFFIDTVIYLSGD